MSSVGVYHPSVRGSVLVCFETLREPFQIFGELCTQLGVISQSVAVQIKSKVMHLLMPIGLERRVTSQLPVVGAADLMDGKRGLVHAVLRACEFRQVRAASSQHGVAEILQTQTHAPVVVDQGAGTA